MEKPKHHIFVCASTRLNATVQGACQKKDSHEILASLVEEVAERELEEVVMVSQMGCVGLCAMGPIVMIYPEKIWYGKVTIDDVSEIMDALEDGEMLKRLAI